MSSPPPNPPTDRPDANTGDSIHVHVGIEWAERGDQVPALLQAAVENNDQNGALKQLKQDSSAWFAQPELQTPAKNAAPAGPSTPTAAAPPMYSAYGDVIVANIGGGASNIAAGKNVQQSVDDSETRKQ
jgi:hypothetical protein